MTRLARVGRRFEIDFSVPATGQTFRGVIDEPPSGEPPAQRFNIPRRILRVRLPNVAEIGQLVLTPSGVEYLVSDHGYSESRDDVLFRAFRLFAITDHLLWEQRTLTKHPVSGVDVDGVMANRGLLAGSFEPDRVTFDKGIEASFPTSHWVCFADVKVDDRVNGLKVVRVDDVLGVKLCELQL